MRNVWVSLILNIFAELVAPTRKTNIKIISGNERISSIMPQISIKLDIENTDSFIQNCRSNHLHWVYGNYVEELQEVCKILKINNITCN